MLDKSITYLNVLMRYDGPPIDNPPLLPNGFHIASYQIGDDLRWAEMEVAINDFDTFENGVKYFRNHYLTKFEKLNERFIGVRDKSNKLCGAVICWDDERNGENVSSVHWLLTDPSVQGKGIGRALVRTLVYRFSKLGLLPIYLHTQPWSYKAIGIYSSIGFRLLVSDTFRGYENQSVQALDVLKEFMTEEKFQKLKNEII